MPPKHFRTLEIGPDADSKMKALLDAVPLRFVLLWTRGLAVSLYALHIRIQGQEWQNVIPSVIADNDGEITAYAGSYPAGTALDVHFGVLAIDGNVEKMATYMVAGANQVAKLKPSAPSAFKSLARGDTWSDDASYTVPTMVIA